MAKWGGDTMLLLRQMKILLFAVFLGLVAGCGSSSSSNDAAEDQQPGGTVISGVVETIEGSADVANSNNGLFDFLIEGFIPKAVADIQGMVAVEGAAVELVRINRDGEEVPVDNVENVITDENGEYRLTLPAGEVITPELLVRIKLQPGSEREYLRAPVTSETVNINPGTEAAVQVLEKMVKQKQVENPEFSFSDLNAGTITAEIIKNESIVQEKVNKLGASDDISTLISAIVEDIEDGMIEAIESALTVNNTLDSGDYHMSAMGFALREEPNRGHLEMFLTSQDLLVETNPDDEPFGEVVRTSTGFKDEFVRREGNSLEATKDSDSENEMMEGSLNSTGALTFLEKADLYCDEDECEVFPQGFLKSQKAKGKNVLLDRIENRIEFYGSKVEAEERVPDRNDVRGQEVIRGIGLSLKAPQSKSLNDLDGDFGVIAQNIALWANGKMENQIVISERTMAGGTYNDTNADQVTIERNLSGDLSVNRDSVPDYGFTYSLAEKTGKLNIVIDAVDSVVGDAIVNDSLDTIVQSYFLEPEDLDNDPVELGYGIALKLPTEKPSISGKEFRLFSVSVHFNDHEYGIFGVGFDTTLVMSSDTEGVIEYEGHSEFMEIAPGSPLDADEPETWTIPVEMNVEDNGLFNFEVNDDTQFKGFFNDDASMAVLRRYYFDEGEPEYELELFILAELEEMTTEQ